MTKSVRKSANETITLLGGVVCTPMAVRSSDRTTTMRTKQVIMIRIEGATLKIVIRAMICIIRSVKMPPPERSIESELGVAEAAPAVAAEAMAGANRIAAKTRRGRKRFIAASLL